MADKVERRSIRLGEDYHLRFRAQARILIRSSNERTYILLNTQQALLVYGDHVDSPPKPDFNYNLDSGALIFAFETTTQPNPIRQLEADYQISECKCYINTVQVSNLESRGKGSPGPCKGLYHLLSLAKVSLVDVLKRRSPPDPSADPSTASHASSLIW